MNASRLERLDTLPERHCFPAGGSEGAETGTSPERRCSSAGGSEGASNLGEVEDLQPEGHCFPAGGSERAHSGGVIGGVGGALPRGVGYGSVDLPAAAGREGRRGESVRPGVRRGGTCTCDRSVGCAAAASLLWRSFAALNIGASTSSSQPPFAPKHGVGGRGTLTAHATCVTPNACAFRFAAMSSNGATQNISPGGSLPPSSIILQRSHSR